MTLRNLIWIYPDRTSTAQRVMEHGGVWDRYAEIAAGLDLSLSLAAPENVHFDVHGNTFVGAQQVTPQDTVFITFLWTMPHQVGDAANMLFLYELLENAGFYLPIHPAAAVLTADKYATLEALRHAGLRTLPSARIGTGRDAAGKSYRTALDGLEFPALVKPAYWAMGIGVSRAHSFEELHGLVGLAGGSNAPLLCQRDLGPGTEDWRVYVIDGRAHTVLRRIPRGLALTANTTSGGAFEFVDLPEELGKPVDLAHEVIGLPYYSLDFLRSNGAFWLSEVEPDAAIGFADSEESATVVRSVVTDRFRSIMRHHDERFAS